MILPKAEDAERLITSSCQCSELSRTDWRILRAHPVNLLEQASNQEGVYEASVNEYVAREPFHLRRDIFEVTKPS